ncbi:TPA: lasso peptide biosynthesis B2 protein [Escherichia coli]
MIRYCLTSYREDLVILDIINDSFSIVPDAGSLLKERDKLLKEFPQLSYFFDSEYHIGSVSRNSDTSFLEERWFLPEPDRTLYKCSLFKRFILLLKVFYYSWNIEKKGMAWIFISNKKENRLYSLNEEHLIRKEISNLSIIFHLNIFKSDCLTYSYALKRILNSRNIDAHLVIGVRTQPFYSHSWVEVGGQVINDAPNMRDKLSVIAEI